MIKKNSNLAIGIFIMGALGILFFSLIFFSNNTLFTDKERVLMYFDGSVQGLQIGAPVKLKGVEVGEIKNIEVIFLSQDLTLTSLVTADIILKRIHQYDNEEKNIFDVVVDQGLRAQLKYQSLLTGLLYVELDFYPDTPIRLLNLQEKYREFPTTKTDFETLFNEIQDIDLRALSIKMASVLSSMDEILKSGRIETMLDNFSSAADSIEKTAKNFNSSTAQFNAQVAKMRTELSTSLEHFNILLESANTELPQISSEFISTLQNLRVSISNLNTLLNSVDNAFAEDSELLYQISKSVEEITRAARGLKELSQTLEEQPEALIRGKRRK